MTSLAKIAGQTIIVEVLRRAVASGKVAHAYLFDGISGCGKTTTARALVASIFCGSGGCGSCATCRKLAAHQHPDLHEVEPDGQNIKIDQIRELQRALSYRPFEAPKKACIIHQAERMNPAAANALLKTLEEPPGEALMILMTDNREALLPTVLSRCQLLQFGPLPEEVVAGILAAEGIDGERAAAAAAMAGGSLTTAREAVNEESADVKRALLSDIIALSHKAPPALLDAAERHGGSKEAALATTDTLLGLYRDILQTKAGGSPVIHGELHDLLATLGQKKNLAAITAGIEALSEMRGALLRNANPRLVMEVLFLRLAGTD